MSMSAMPMSNGLLQLFTYTSGIDLQKCKNKIQVKFVPNNTFIFLSDVFVHYDMDLVV